MSNRYFVRTRIYKGTVPALAIWLVERTGTTEHCLLAGTLSVPRGEAVLADLAARGLAVEREDSPFEVPAAKDLFTEGA